MKRGSRITSLVFGALVAAMLVAQAPVARAEATCPVITPLHGLLPWLIRLGILPKPIIASTIAPSDTSTSIVIRPDPNDQITCGKTSIRMTEDVVFTTRTLPNGKSLDLLMDIQVPEPTKKRPLVVYVPG